MTEGVSPVQKVDENQPLPQLIIIDGKGQLSAALKVSMI
jgi:excinuclease UvrABC nuclease subunit